MKGRIVALVSLAFVLALVFATTPASAATIEGWELTRGTNFDLYMTPRNVSYVEMVLFINYGSSEMLLKVTAGDKTYFSQVVAAHSSQFCEIAFTDITSYTMTVSSGGTVIWSVVKARTGVTLLPPANDANWHLQPPNTDAMNPAIFSQEDWDSMVAWMTLENVATAALIMTSGAVIGAAVKRTTRFLRPADFLSLAFMAALASDYLFRFLGEFDRIWYAPLAIGYLIGFLLWHIDYIMPVRTDCKEKNLDVRPVVVYQPLEGNGWLIQVQKNRELAKRLLFGIEHRLTTDTGLIQEWTGRFKGLRGRGIRGRVLWVQKTDVRESTVKVLGFDLKRYETVFKLSHASGVEKAQWLNEAKWYFRLQDKYDRLALKYSDLLLGHRTESAEISAAMVEHSTGVNPARRVKRFFGDANGPIDLDTGENTLTTIEAVDSGADDVNEPRDQEAEGPEKVRTKEKDEDEEMEG